MCPPPSTTTGIRPAARVCVMMASASAVAVVAILVLVLGGCLAQNIHELHHQLASDNTTSPDEGDKRPPCVLINNYCGKEVPGTGMRKECCGDLICYKNKCRRRTCC